MKFWIYTLYFISFLCKINIKRVGGGIPDGRAGKRRGLYKYRTAGVREYWVVDFDREIVTVYDFKDDDMKEYAFGEDVPVGIYEGFAIKVGL